jgi:hypothetical protein
MSVLKPRDLCYFDEAGDQQDDKLHNDILSQGDDFRKTLKTRLMTRGLTEAQADVLGKLAHG